MSTLFRVQNALVPRRKYHTSIIHKNTTKAIPYGKKVRFPYE